jgi:hypothetical protein
MIWVAGVLAYIGIGGLVAVWVDHQNEDLVPLAKLPALTYGAFWLPLGVIGLGAILFSMASGAVKRRR